MRTRHSWSLRYSELWFIWRVETDYGWFSKWITGGRFHKRDGEESSGDRDTRSLGGGHPVDQESPEGRHPGVRIFQKVELHMAPSDKREEFDFLASTRAGLWSDLLTSGGSSGTRPWTYSMWYFHFLHWNTPASAGTETLSTPGPTSCPWPRPGVSPVPPPSWPWPSPPPSRRRRTQLFTTLTGSTARSCFLSW